MTQIYDEIISRCVETKKGIGSIICVVINACKSHVVAEKLWNEGVKHVICWKTLVNDEATKAFAESLYRTLGAEEDNYVNFSFAFEKTVRDLSMLGWFIADPNDVESLRKKQQERFKLGMKASGIPLMYPNVSHCKNQVNFHGVSIRLPSL